MKLLKTNSKEYMKNIEDYIFNCIDLDYFELENNPIEKKDILQLVADEIKRVAFYDNNIRLFKGNKVAIIADHFQGLPSYFNLAFSNYDILKDAAKIHNIEDIPENKEDIIINNWWLHIATKLIQLFNKYNVSF